jgi:hypothetical protein
MTPLSLESFFLLATLLIAGISLFLSVFNALLLFDLSKRITSLKKKMSLMGEKDDIFTGMQNIALNYHLNSLVVATSDGLVVASAGSNDPESEAAHFSSLFTGKFTRSEQDTWLLPLEHRGISLIGIARSQDTLPTEVASRMVEEIEFLLEQGL